MRAPYPALVALLVVDRLVERPSIDMLLEATPAPAIKSPAVSSGSIEATRHIRSMISGGYGYVVPSNPALYSNRK